jgi:hypothetical protein
MKRGGAPTCSSQRAQVRAAGGAEDAESRRALDRGCAEHVRSHRRGRDHDDDLFDHDVDDDRVGRTHHECAARERTADHGGTAPATATVPAR